MKQRKSWYLKNDESTGSALERTIEEEDEEDEESKKHQSTKLSRQRLDTKVPMLGLNIESFDESTP